MALSREPPDPFMQALHPNMLLKDISGFSLAFMVCNLPRHYIGVVKVPFLPWRPCLSTKMTAIRSWSLSGHSVLKPILPLLPLIKPTLLFSFLNMLCLGHWYSLFPKPKHQDCVKNASITDELFGVSRIFFSTLSANTAICNFLSAWLWHVFNA